MADITQATDYNKVTFSADTADAEEWMGAATVEFELPEQSQEALAFKKAAEAKGFAISDL